MSRFSTVSKPLLLKFCQNQLKHIKQSGALALPEADTHDHKFQRCDMLLAAVALSSLNMHPAIDSCSCITVSVSSCIDCCQR